MKNWKSLVHTACIRTHDLGSRVDVRSDRPPQLLRFVCSSRYCLGLATQWLGTLTGGPFFFTHHTKDIIIHWLILHYVSEFSLSQMILLYKPFLGMETDFSSRSLIMSLDLLSRDFLSFDLLSLVRSRDFLSLKREVYSKIELFESIILSRNINVT